MADSTDPMKLSSFVSSIVDRKIKVLTTSMFYIASVLNDHTLKLGKLKTFQNRFARGSNAFGNWELRPGVIEMWGRYANTADRESAQTFGFPLVLPNTTYNISAIPVITAASATKDLGVQIINSTRQVAQAQVYYQSATADAAQKLDGFDWRIICIVPFDYALTENTSTPAAGTGDASGTTRVAVANARSEV